MWRLFMAVAGVDIKSGAYTLAQRLRLEGRLSLDLMQRFGEELLIVADWLRHGIAHRDIKLDNIGVGRSTIGPIDASAVRLFPGPYPGGKPPRRHAALSGPLHPTPPTPTLGPLCRALRHRHDVV